MHCIVCLAPLDEFARSNRKFCRNGGECGQLLRRLQVAKDLNDKEKEMKQRLIENGYITEEA